MQTIGAAKFKLLRQAEIFGFNGRRYCVDSRFKEQRLYSGNWAIF